MQAVLFILDVRETSWCFFFKAYKTLNKKHKKIYKYFPKMEQKAEGLAEKTQKHKSNIWPSVKVLWLLKCSCPWRFKSQVCEMHYSSKPLHVVVAI